MKETKSNLLVYAKKYGSVAQQDRRMERKESFADQDLGQRPNLVMSAYNCWSSLEQLRRDIRRNEEFVFGDQHSDRVYDYKNHRYITERNLFVEQGLQPSQYNIIRNVLRTIIGVWSTNKTLPVCVAQIEENQPESDVLTATLHALYRKNELWKFDYSQLLQLLLSGLMITKNHYVNRDGDSDIVNDYISPFNFFVDNSMKDPRYKDCSLVGCFYDMSVDDIVGMFSKGSKQRGSKIRDLYRSANQERIYEMTQTFTDERIEKDFFMPDVESYGLGRVIEVWRKESAECYWVHDRLNGTYYPDFKSTEAQLKAVNELRKEEQGDMGVLPENMLLLEPEWGTSAYWKYYFLTPFGEVLDEGINPFWHEKAPIVFEIHEFFIGKIYPFCKDLIDTQKQINKLSAISELLTKYSAKSGMFIPVQSIAEAEGYGIDYLEKNMTNFDAIFPYNAQAGIPAPNFINTISQAFTPLNVVNMYLKLSENVSGVYGALQGATPTSGTPAQMYAQQSQNSATSLNGIFEAVNSFRTRRDKMDVQLMQQFYRGKRWVYDKKSGKRLLWDHDKVKNVEFEINTVENTDTPAYRLMVNDLLFQLKQYDTTNMLDLRGLIEAGNLPFKEQLLEYLNRREQQMKDAAKQAQQQQEQPGGQATPGQGLPPELQQQLSQYQFSPELQQKFAGLPPEVQHSVAQEAVKK